MIEIKQKPVSVNDCWQGRRFKTDAYKTYEKMMLLILPKLNLPNPPFKVVLEFGFSNGAADLDNPVKPLLDIMQKKYGFNDKAISELNIKKAVVPKGKEFIRFAIKPAA